MDSTITYWDFATTVFYKKWLDESHIDSSALNENPVRTEIPLTLLRYTQTLLTWAEAETYLGDAGADVIDVINRIRRRANHVDIHTESDFDLPANTGRELGLNSIIRESAWELSMEPEGRWFDVVRLELLNELDKNRNPKDQKITFNDQLSTDPYFFKNPESDKWLIEEIRGESKK